MFTNQGLRFEVHKIVTEDGYINTAWRVPGLLEERPEDMMKRKPVILQHGLMDNSGTWVVPHFEDQLPKQLVDQGYDVWMMNSRGSRNSFEHKDPHEYSVYRSHSKYWQFNWDDMAEFDVPAHIDYVLSTSGHESLAYIGHSQGTVQFFAANAM